jgi:catechol-2,3-dioxygenase
MPRVTMVQHVNVQITDRQRTREWYEKVLGAGFRHASPFTGGRVRKRTTSG